jgi:hypothetical protein
MIRVCCYRGCGTIYGEKEPLSNKGTTHGLCPRHLEMTLKEIRAEQDPPNRHRACHGQARSLTKPSG